MPVWSYTNHGNAITTPSASAAAVATAACHASISGMSWLFYWDDVQHNAPISATSAVGSVTVTGDFTSFHASGAVSGTALVITGPGIPAGATYITNINSTTSCTISTAANAAAGAGTFSVFDFTLIDAAVNFAWARSLYSTLRVNAGNNGTPAWAKTIGPLVTINAGTFIVPWHPNFLNPWAIWIAVYGARYDRNVAAYMIQCSGPGWQGEGSLGNWTSVVDPLSVGWMQPTETGWAGLGVGANGPPYTPAKITAAWSTTITNYYNAFPNTLLCNTIDEPLTGVPGFSSTTTYVPGQIVSNSGYIYVNILTNPGHQGVSNATYWTESTVAGTADTSAQLRTNAANIGITRFQVGNALGGFISRSTGHAQYDLAVATLALGYKIGWQQWLTAQDSMYPGHPPGPDPGSATSDVQWFSNMVDIAVTTGATHVELYHADVIAATATDGLIYQGRNSYTADIARLYASSGGIVSGAGISVTRRGGKLF